MDIFSDDEPDLMDLELVREFDNLIEKFYRFFDDDLNESRANSKLLIGNRSKIFREEVVVLKRDYYSGVRPKQRKVRGKVEPVPYLRKGVLTMSLNRISEKKTVQRTSSSMIKKS